MNFSINQNEENPDIIREIISSELMSNPNVYNSIVLDKNPESFCKWTMIKETRGGGI